MFFFPSHTRSSLILRFYGKGQTSGDGRAYEHIISLFWPKSAFRFPPMTLLQNLNKVFGQPNISTPGGSDGKESACNAGDPRLIPGLRKSPGERNGNPLKYSCPENPMNRGAWWAMVHGVSKSQTELSTHTHTNYNFSVLVVV